ncbi:hypothetical protein VARIO8X_150038 [Burkholderiales bacterium 8X]|nr:hypothetical protein VARIO8X_150038 [Burkholderiales bacterium 8X]
MLFTSAFEGLVESLTTPIVRFSLRERSMINYNALDGKANPQDEAFARIYRAIKATPEGRDFQTNPSLMAAPKRSLLFRKICYPVVHEAPSARRLQVAY